MVHGTRGVLRPADHRERRGPQGAGLRHGLWTDHARRVHPAEQGATVLPVPGLQRSVLAGHAAGEPGAEPASRLLRGQGAAVVPSRRDAPVAVQQQGISEQPGVDPARGGRNQRRRRRRGRRHGRAQATSDSTKTRSWSTPPIRAGWAAQRHLGHGRPHPAASARFDGMMQIPLLFRQPGKIPPGATSDILVSNYDFLPSVLATSAWATSSPARPHRRAATSRPACADGTSRLGKRSVLRDGDVPRDPHGPMQVRAPADGPFELYDLEADPYEKFNLYGQPHSPPATRTPAAARSVLRQVRRAEVRPIPRRRLEGQSASGGSRPTAPRDPVRRRVTES